MLTSIYTLTIFTSAFLLFLIQPMIAKLLLPSLGGTPALWNTSMVFFQTMLLLGYAYAHISTKLLGATKQAWLHLALLVIALAWLPVVAKTDLGFASVEQPIRWVITSLLFSVGAPFFVLAANAPLLQFWLSRTNHKDAHNPYFLYSASNIGSLLALFSYPFVIEPLLTLPRQTGLWTLLFMVFVACLAACVFLLKRHESAPVADRIAAPTAKPTLTKKIHWVLLAFCPSSLLLGVTTYITTDITSIPLFWVIPLALYLLTFIMAFARKPLWVEQALNAQPILAVPIFIAIVFNIIFNSLFILHLLFFFTLCLGCHGILARNKPDSSHLTEYYLWISLGGMLGGVFNALIAPVVFTTPVEYPVMLILTLLLRPEDNSSANPKREAKLDLLVPVLFFVFLFLCRLAGAMALRHTATDPHSNAMLQALGQGIIFIILAIAIYKTYKRNIRLTLMILAFVGVIPLTQLSGTAQSSDKQAGSTTQASDTMIYAQRNFFGVNRVYQVESPPSMVLSHGTTVHGKQSLEPGNRLQLTTYYYVLGDVFAHLPATVKNKPVAALGLGAGTVACLGHSGQSFDFFEIDPAVVTISRDMALFTFLRDCKPKSNIILGDGRLEMAKTEDCRYGFIIIDTFSSDAIPVHIITREALKIYLSKLAPGGVIAVNISNRHLNLAPVIAALASDAGLDALIKSDDRPDGGLITSSVWVLMAHARADFNRLEKDDPTWIPLDNSKKFTVWTDNYSNIFETLF